MKSTRSAWVSWRRSVSVCENYASSLILLINAANFLFGYLLWSIDFHLCSYVTKAKHYVGLPWGFLFELHGWWHIFTGIGAYIGMALTEYLVTIEEGQTGRVEEGFVWPVKSVLRDLDAVAHTKKVR